MISAGEEDRIVESEQAKRLHAVLPRSVLQPIPGAGHMVHHYRPEALYDGVELIKAWP